MKANSLYIVYGRYYDFDTECVTIGGVQTYISNLIELSGSLFDKVTLFQMGTKDETRKLPICRIIQFETNSQDKFEKLVYRWITQNDLIDRCIVLFATDSIIFQKYRFINSIVIQHGVSWDIPKTGSNRKLERVILSKAISAYKTIRNLERVNRVVCVDYNFQNWFRSLTTSGSEKLQVIPNFTDIAPKFTKPSQRIKIIFARRLFPYRGTRVFTDAIVKVLDEFSNIEVTVAGDGPDEQWMRDKLGKYNNVFFTKYDSSESIQMHSDKHIAVVPTVGSEGTSLSLLEAMSAQCAVICTDVGGMTNIVIDGFNGLMVKAGNSEALYNALKRLIVDENLREQISNNAYSTIKQSFSLEKWQNKWKNVLCN